MSIEKLEFQLNIAVSPNRHLEIDKCSRTFSDMFDLTTRNHVSILLVKGKTLY